MPFLNQRKEENDGRKYFRIKSPRKNVADPAGTHPLCKFHMELITAKEVMVMTRCIKG